MYNFFSKTILSKAFVRHMLIIHFINFSVIINDFFQTKHNTILNSNRGFDKNL